MRWVRQGIVPCFFVFYALLALVAPGSPAHAGGVWMDAGIPPVAPMNAVSFADRANAWAVGNQGNILRFRLGSWNIFPSATDMDLFAVTSQGEDDAWAVGAGGTIMHWNGDRWAVHPASGVVTIKDLYAVAFLNENNGWAAGGDAGGGIILHYDGTAWTVENLPADRVTGIAAVASDYIWFCGYNRSLILFNGTGFSAGPALVGDGLAWRAISFPYRRLGWVVGDNGAIGRFSPSKYTVPIRQGWGTYYVDSYGITSPPTKGYATTSSQLNGISVLPDPEWGYAVGAGGIRLRLGDDSLFREEATGGADLQDIDLVNHEEGAAAGGATLTGPRIAMIRERTIESGFPNVRVYPNPFEPMKGGIISIDRLPGDASKIEFFTMEGDRVAAIGNGVEYRSDIGVATWDGKVAGKYAASGAYLIRLSAPKVTTKTIVFLLVKR